MRRFETRHSQVLNPLGSCHQVAHLLRPRATFHPAAAKPLPHGVELGLNDVIFALPVGGVSEKARRGRMLWLSVKFFE